MLAISILAVANVYVLEAVDTYGTKKLSPADLIAEAGLAVGKPLDWGELDAAETRLKAAHAKDVVYLRVSGITYFGGANAGKGFVTIDVVEPGDEARMHFAPEPKGRPADPGGLVARWEAYEKRAFALLREGKLDMSKGGKCDAKALHCALGFGHPELAPLEKAFVTGVPKRVAALAEVLHSHRDAPARGAAAFLLAYAPDRDAVVRALTPAVRDPSSFVRNNAMRVLMEIQTKTERLILPVDDLLAAIDFPDVTDRNKSLYGVLAALKQSPEIRPKVEARRATLELLSKMKQPNNADPAAEILKLLEAK